MIPSSPPADFAELITRDRAELLRLLEGLEDGDWSDASPCPGWSVLDVAVHLVGVDLGVLARDRDGHLGTPVPDEVESEEEFVAFIDEINDLWSRAGRRRSPRLTVGLLRWTGPQLADLYRYQEMTQATARVSWASDGPVPKWLDQGRELTERWIHHQQIRQALGLACWHDGEVTGVVLDVLSWAFPFRLGGVERPGGTRVEVAITGAVSRLWSFTADGTGWVRAEGAESVEPAVRLTMDADTAWRLLSGGLPSDQYPVPQRDGDPELTRILLRTRAVIGLPDDDPTDAWVPGSRGRLGS